MAAGSRAGNIRNKNQAIAASMKDTPSRKGVERMLCRCPMCNGLVPRLIEGCKNEQRGRMVEHIMSCKGGLSIRR